MGYLTADAIQAATRRYEDLEIPQWGGAVRLQSLSAAEWESFDLENIGQDGKQRNWIGMRARLAVRTLVDKDGNRLYGDKDWMRVNDFMDRKALDAIYEKSMQMNATSKELLDGLEKNLDETDGDDSHTD